MKKEVPSKVIILIGLCLWALRFLDGGVYIEAFSILGDTLFLTGLIALILKKVRGKKVTRT